MTSRPAFELPAVAMWRIHMLRIIFFLMVAVMGSAVWQQILFEPEPWPLHRMLSKSILGALALVCVLGVRYPLHMLPLMLLEIAWKTTYILGFYLPAWLSGTVTPEMQTLFAECIGIVVAYLIVPWRYVWARYVQQPSEAWRGPSATVSDGHAPPAA